jgi:hypothetical protein
MAILDLQGMQAPATTDVVKPFRDELIARTVRGALRTVRGARCAARCAAAPPPELFPRAPAWPA